MPIQKITKGNFFINDSFNHQFQDFMKIVTFYFPILLANLKLDEFLYQSPFRDMPDLKRV